jgi:hypothetical protein
VAAAVAAGCIPRRGGYWPIARPRGARAPSLSRSLPRACVRASVCRREERESGVMEGGGGRELAERQPRLPRKNLRLRQRPRELCP